MFKVGQLLALNTSLIHTRGVYEGGGGDSTSVEYQLSRTPLPGRER